MHDPFGRNRLPGDWSRSGRVALLQEAAAALIEGRAPSREASMFLGSALGAWLAEGGNLERDYLKLKAQPGSHHTVQRLAAKLKK